MSIKFVVAHSKDPNNVGDIASNPLQYFLKESEYQTIDVGNLGQEAYPVDVPLIVGGGGLIGNDFFGDFFNDLLEPPDRLQLERMWSETWITANPKYSNLSKEFHNSYQDLISKTLEKIDKVTAPRAVWGAGHNGAETKEFSSIKWPKALAKYKLVGIRDYDPSSRFEWVPCASCMHPALKKTYAIKNDVIWFEHKKQLIKDFGKDTIPRFINSGANVEQTIELLGSTNIILTNSYHGAYWGTLLKKKVIIAGGAWSSKFNFFKHKLFILGKKDYWKDCVDQTITYNHALDECVAATEQYWNRVKELK
jgi:hypothetical protein